MDKPYLELRDLTVGYGGKPLLSHISFSLQKGEIMTLVGPNGAGKSTVLKTVTRRLPALSGKILLDGTELRALSGRSVATKMAAVLTDRIRPELATCFDIVSAGRYPYTGSFGLLTKRDREIVADALRRVSITDIADRDFNSVSDGQRQRVLLARAIAQEPEIVVLDEPTSFLDIRHKIGLLEILRDMARTRGVAVLMSLHEIDLASKVSDRIVCVGHGGIAAQGRPEDVFSDGSVRALYGLTRGSYNAALGSVELARSEGEPHIFVLGGGGRGIPLYRALQKSGIPFAAGILFDNDLDLPVANSLAAAVVASPAFLPVSEDTFRAARALLASSAAVLTPGPESVLPPPCGELLTCARALRIPVVTDPDEIPRILKSD